MERTVTPRETAYDPYDFANRRHIGPSPEEIQAMLETVGAASLEAFAGVCLGCIIYNRIWGCEDCFDITDRMVALSRAKANA